MTLLEICVGSVASAKIAQHAGGGRLELCAALQLGGYTPSWGMMTAVRDAVTIPMNVIIRNINGRYVFTKDEIEVMVRDIKIARQVGADGVVIGALTAEGRVDMEACKPMMEAAKGLPVTFHRAFDLVNDKTEGLEDLIALGCARVLTSAGAPVVPQGMEGLEKLMAQAGDRIIIMPGGGVTADNAADIVKRLGSKEMHGTFRAPNAALAADTSFDELKKAVESLK